MRNGLALRPDVLAMPFVLDAPRRRDLRPSPVTAVHGFPAADFGRLRRDPACGSATRSSSRGSASTFLRLLGASAAEALAPDKRLSSECEFSLCTQRQARCGKQRKRRELHLGGRGLGSRGAARRDGASGRGSLQRGLRTRPWAGEGGVWRRVGVEATGTGMRGVAQGGGHTHATAAGSPGALCGPATRHRPPRDPEPGASIPGLVK